LSRLKDIAVFVVGSFLLPHPVDPKQHSTVLLEIPNSTGRLSLLPSVGW